RTPATTGAPIVTSAPCPTSCTSVNATVSPTAPVSFSTSIVSPGITRYCRPPVLTIAYISYPLPSRAIVPHPALCRHCRRHVRPGACYTMQKVGGERTTCRAGLSSRHPSRHFVLLLLVHTPHSVYSTIYGMEPNFHPYHVTRS